MTDTIIGLLRHGQTDWNIDFRLQGTSDIPLNEVGLKQARTAAEGISGDWDVIIASPLSRALDTAKIVAAYHELGEVLVEPLLLERSFGEAEGLRYEVWREKYPDSHVPGGETIEALEKRARRLLDSLAERFPGKRVLTVSHGALIRNLINIVSDGEFPREGERLGNASLTTIAHHSAGWEIETYAPQTIS
jgi:uncharacterized phosphatase